MSGAIWSDEPPAKAGWYWIKSPGERDGHARFFNGEAWAVGEDTECRGCVDGLNKFPTAYQYGPRVPSAETLVAMIELCDGVLEMRDCQLCGSMVHDEWCPARKLAKLEGRDD